MMIPINIFLTLVGMHLISGTYGKRNIVFIVADDLGWNDVSWHNPKIKTPNLEKLARQGVILNQNYVQPVCTPSRTAFMTGYYPFHTGHQHYVLWPWQDVGLAMKYSLLPQKLKENGYKTHAIGKWHLGFCNWLFTPTFRGFDSFYGFYLGSQDYYTHRRSYLGGDGLDFRHNLTLALADNNTYSAEVFSREAVKIIADHDTKDPLFMYIAFQNVHVPLQVPLKYRQKYLNITNRPRRIYSGMVSALDDAIGNITQALEKKRILKDTLIIFTSDNGGQILGGGNNYPLRGNKHTLWEGGTRVPAFVSGAGIKLTNYTNKNMIHAVDWYPTLLSAAGATNFTNKDIDGIDQWLTLSSNVTTNRKEFVYNIDEVEPTAAAAIRSGQYKLIVGYPGDHNSWYPEPTENWLQPVEGSDHRPSTPRRQSPALLRMLEDFVDDDVEGTERQQRERYRLIRERQRNQNSLQQLNDVVTRADGTMYLFDLQNDPEERVNLISALPAVKRKLLKKLRAYWSTLQPAKNPANTPYANPKYFHDSYSPGWC